MSYNTISTMKDDPLLRQRIVACAAQERESRGQTYPDHEAWVAAHIWTFVTHQDWVNAYAYAVATNVPDPGSNESVVTDAMILAGVQPVVIAETRT